MLYPLKFEPVYKRCLWGGRNFEKLGRALPDGKIGESWEVSCHPHGISIIANGQYKGLPLPQFLDSFGQSAIGWELAEKGICSFPLLVKLLDASDKLSVQVHPGDAFARQVEQQPFGKNELWYVLMAEPGAQIIYHTKSNIKKEQFRQAVDSKQVEQCLNYVTVSAGDVIDIPAGTLHALGEGIMVAEIQQSSDITYRVYDYDRIDKDGQKRPLHIEKAFDAIHFSGINAATKITGLEVKLGADCHKRYLKADPSFAVELYDVNGSVEEYADGRRFYLFTVIDGEGEIAWENDGCLRLKTVESFMIPASLGKYRISGKLKLLKSYVPAVHTEIKQQLRLAGYSDTAICSNIAGLR